MPGSRSEFRSNLKHLQKRNGSGTRGNIPLVPKTQERDWN